MPERSYIELLNRLQGYKGELVALKRQIKSLISSLQEILKAVEDNVSFEEIKSHLRRVWLKLETIRV